MNSLAVIKWIEKIIVNLAPLNERSRVVTKANSILIVFSPNRFSRLLLIEAQLPEE
jgi:hypothetical protein